MSMIQSLVTSVKTSRTRLPDDKADNRLLFVRNEANTERIATKNILREQHATQLWQQRGKPVHVLD
jgi:hypothetical protein